MWIPLKGRGMGAGEVKTLAIKMSLIVTRMIINGPKNIIQNMITGRNKNVFIQRFEFDAKLLHSWAKDTLKIMSFPKLFIISKKHKEIKTTFSKIWENEKNQENQD